MSNVERTIFGTKNSEWKVITCLSLAVLSTNFIPHFIYMLGVEYFNEVVFVIFFVVIQS